MWANDQYTGFMDLVIGEISLAGWWHLIYAGLETTIVLTYLFVWITSLAADGIAHGIAAAGWRWFIAYCSLGIADLLLHWRTAFAGLALSKVLLIESPNIIKLLLALAVLDLFRRVHRSLVISSSTSNGSATAGDRT
jgi:hypothetical protein